MAPKRLPLEHPPSASSSSSSSSDEETDREEEEAAPNREQTSSDVESEQEEEEEGSEDGGESEEDEDDDGKNTKPFVQNSTPQPDSFSDGSDAETHSGHNQPSPTVSDFTVKPIASKSMEDSKPALKPALKPTPKPAAKRPAGSENNHGTVTDPRKRKANVSNGDEEEKKSGGAIVRLWSEDDEIVILKGMIEYKARKGADPNSDMGEFHEFIRQSLTVEVTRNQLMDKVRRLKKKYRNNVEKGEKGEDPVFSKPHEHKSFELSKKIWGGGDDNAVQGNGKSSNKRARKSGKVEKSVASPFKENGKEIALMEQLKGRKDVFVDKEDFWSMYPCLKESLEREAPASLSMSGPGKIFMMENMSVIGNTKAMELEMKWKNLRMDEIALYLKRAELIGEQTKLMLDAMKSAK